MGLALLLTFAGRAPAQEIGEEEPVDKAVVSLDAHALVDEDVELFELEVPVVVTAARREQKITMVPHAVSVITAEDIRLSGARSIPDALRLVPGVDVSDLGSGAAAVSVRGLHGLVSRTVLVLVDGRQVFDSLFGGTLWGSWPFQLEDIERIEVIRGPGGVTWGANAVDGVINIITKDPADQLGLKFTAGGGSRGYYKTHTGYAFKDGDLRMRVSGEYEASDGFKGGGSILRSLDDEYKGGRMSLHAIYDWSPKDSLTVSAGSGLVDGAYAPTPLAGMDVRHNSGSQASYLFGKWSHEVTDDNRWELTGYVNDFQLSAGLRAIDYRYQQLALQFGHTFAPTDQHTVSWGIDSRVDLLDASNSDPFLLTEDFVSTAILGLYVQDQWRFAPKWTLDLGARIDYEFYGGFQPSARAALSYALTNSSAIYGAVSRAFQMPPAAMRYLDIPLLNGLARVQGDREMQALTLLAYEFGYRGRFFDRLDTTFNWFWHEYEHFTPLVPGLGPPGLLTYTVSDRASVSMYGVELDARYKVNKEFTLLGNYTVQWLDWQSSEAFHETDVMVPPKHKAMVGARYSATDDLHLSSHLYYVDSTKAPNPSFPFMPSRIDPYMRLDLRAEYELWDDQASIAVGVRNLLDGGHFEGGTLFLNNAEVPRMVFAEFRLAL
ncbi:MAG: TonB-dependent receptor [Planctomycetota bacterium]